MVKNSLSQISKAYGHVSEASLIFAFVLTPPSSLSSIYGDSQHTANFSGRNRQSGLVNLALQFQVYGDLLHFIRDLRQVFSRLVVLNSLISGYKVQSEY